MAQDLGMHRNVEDWRCPAQDRGLSSIPNLAPRNSKSDVGFGLAMSSWSRSTARMYNKATSYHNVYPLNRASVFLCSYLVSCMSPAVRPFSSFSYLVFVNHRLVSAHPLAHVRLGQCLEALIAIWSSAERAHRSHYHWSTLDWWISIMMILPDAPCQILKSGMLPWVWDPMPLQRFNDFLISRLDITLQQYHSEPAQILQVKPVPEDSGKLSAAAFGFAVATRHKGRKSASRKRYFHTFPCSNVDQCNCSGQYGRRWSIIWWSDWGHYNKRERYHLQCS